MKTYSLLLKLTMAIFLFSTLTTFTNSNMVPVNPPKSDESNKPDPPKEPESPSAPKPKPERKFNHLSTSEELLELLQNSSRVLVFLLNAAQKTDKSFQKELDAYWAEMIILVKDLEAKTVDCSQNLDLCTEIMGQTKNAVPNSTPETFVTRAIIYEARRNEKIEYSNNMEEFFDRIKFLTIPKIRTIKTSEKLEYFFKYPIGMVSYIDPSQDEQLETVKKLAALGRKRSNIFFEMGNIPGVIKPADMFSQEIKKGGYGFYLTLKINDDRKIMRKYPYHNEDYEALTEWVEIESLPDVTEYSGNSFNRIFRGSLRTQVILFVKDKNSEKSLNMANELMLASRYNREEDLYSHRAVFVFAEYGSDLEFEKAFGVYDHDKDRLFIASSERGEFQRFSFDGELEKGQELVQVNISKFLDEVRNRNWPAMFLSEPLGRMGPMTEIGHGENVRRIVADAFREEVTKSKINQVLMLCNDKEGCDFQKKSFAWLANRAKLAGEPLEFLFMNADINEVLFFCSTPITKLRSKECKSLSTPTL
jgi:hypothetical protein